MNMLQGLDSTEKLEVIGLFAKGYTIRTIRRKLEARAMEEGRTELMPTDQDLLTLAVRYSSDIEEHRRQLAKDVLTRGLATKEERIRRLSEAAEAIENDVLMGVNIKATEQYRKLLDSIREEVEPLHINILLPDDPWHMLLIDLRKKAEMRGALQGEVPMLPPTLQELLPSPESESDPSQMKSTQSAQLSKDSDTSHPMTPKELFFTSTEEVSRSQEEKEPESHTFQQSFW